MTLAQRHIEAQQGRTTLSSRPAPVRILDDSGGLNFIEVVVALIMLVAAVVATTYSIYYANRSMKIDMHKQQVRRLVEMEIENWVGRMYYDWGNVGGQGAVIAPNAFQINGSGSNPYKTIALDNASNEDAIQVRMYYDAMLPSYYAVGEQLLVAYYKLTVWAEWTEHDGTDFTREKNNTVVITTYVSGM